MAQVTITALKRTPRMSKAGKAFVSLGLKTTEYGDKWLSGFAGDENSHWQEGDVVDIEITQKDEYLNFKTNKVNQVSKGEGNDSRVFNLLNLKILPLLEVIAEDIKATRKKQIMEEYPEHSPTAFDEPTEGVTQEDSPF